jgi:hypothetical protein
MYSTNKITSSTESVIESNSNFKLLAPQHTLSSPRSISWTLLFSSYTPRNALRSVMEVFFNFTRYLMCLICSCGYDEAWLLQIKIRCRAIFSSLIATSHLLWNWIRWPYLRQQSTNIEGDLGKAEPSLWISRNWDVKKWTGSSCIRIGTVGGHLWMWSWAFGFHKMREMFWPNENRFCFKPVLCSLE